MRTREAISNTGVLRVAPYYKERYAHLLGTHVKQIDFSSPERAEKYDCHQCVPKENRVVHVFESNNSILSIIMPLNETRDLKVQQDYVTAYSKHQIEKFCTSEESSVIHYPSIILLDDNQLALVVRASQEQRTSLQQSLDSDLGVDTYMLFILLDAAEGLYQKIGQN